LKVVSWNMHNRDDGWPLLRDLEPDVALIQEVRSVPDEVASSYQIVCRHAVDRSGQPQNFSTAILVNGSVDHELELSSPWPWVDTQLDKFDGIFVGASTKISDLKINVLSVHSPYWRILSSSELSLIEGSDQVKRENNPHLGGVDLLWAALKERTAVGTWMVGGDVNVCETFDSWGPRPRGSREFLDRMRDLGLTEVLREAQGQLTPTYRKFKTGECRNQMDYLWVSKDLANRLVSCEVGDPDVVFAKGLSDHLPIIAEFS
jgi:exonuclease III